MELFTCGLISDVWYLICIYNNTVVIHDTKCFNTGQFAVPTVIIVKFDWCSIHKQLTLITGAIQQHKLKLKPIVIVICFILISSFSLVC